MASKIQQRRDTAANWAASNPILAQGEIGVVIDKASQFKIGDGVTTWNSLSPVSTTAGASSSNKLLVIADSGFGTNYSTPSTSTPGTSESLFTVGAAATGITAEWEHWYSTTTLDNDPTGPISFNASLRIVSSSNPNTVIGTIYRINFGGRTTATLDPGGRIVGDIVGVSVNPGDVVAIRTYLASGTAYCPREIVGAPITGTGWGGFTATTDLTAPGSAAVTAATAWVYGPSAVLGHQTGGAPSVLLVGDSILVGAYDGYYGIAGGLIPGHEAYAGGGAFVRAISGHGGTINIGRLGDRADLFVGTNSSFHRLKNVQRCTSAIINYGHNDLGNSDTAPTLQANLLAIANSLRASGISKVYITTLTPNTTSTDGFATTTNQSVQPSESNRVTHNTWVRANCPIDPATLAPVAVGTPNAMVAGSFGHPLTGFFDTGGRVESALNSGFWLPCQRVTTGSASSGNALTSSAANFQTASQESGGDLGSTFSLMGAGPSGAVAVGWVSSVTSSTQCVTIFNNPGFGTTVTNAQLNMGILTVDGTHPSTRGHYLMSQAINPAVLIP